MKEDKIYANFIDNEFEELPFKQAQEGNFIKSTEQIKWEKEVAEAIASIEFEGVQCSVAQ